MAQQQNKRRCRDCTCCQSCSKDRCRVCLKEPKGEGESSLGRSFTYGEYLQWKEMRQHPKTLHIDHFECTDCESCVSLCPSVFRKNKDTGLIEIEDSAPLPEEDIRLAMCMCPADCIQWEEA
ncbi:MAG: ferredoxin [Desulfobacteraceae bacterium]|nr:MAG: ferredoxin [Desulfobacteraceae bacterium]